MRRTHPHATPHCVPTSARLAGRALVSLEAPVDASSIGADARDAS